MLSLTYTCSGLFCARDTDKTLDTDPSLADRAICWPSSCILCVMTCHDRPCDVWRCVTYCVTDHPHLWWTNERVMTMLWWNWVIIGQTTCAVTSWLGDLLQNRRGWFWLVWLLKRILKPVSILLLFLVDRKLKRFYILITAELLLIQNTKSSGLCNTLHRYWLLVGTKKTD